MPRLRAVRPRAVVLNSGHVSPRRLDRNASSILAPGPGEVKKAEVGRAGIEPKSPANLVLFWLEHWVGGRLGAVHSTGPFRPKWAAVVGFDTEKIQRYDCDTQTTPDRCRCAPNLGYAAAGCRRRGGRSEHGQALAYPAGVSGNGQHFARHSRRRTSQDRQTSGKRELFIGERTRFVPSVEKPEAFGGPAAPRQGARIVDREEPNRRADLEQVLDSLFRASGLDA
jgi:hypothetical protein